MDKIQAFLVKAGQKELAQEYFVKFSSYDDLTAQQKSAIDLDDFLEDDGIVETFIEHLSWGRHGYGADNLWKNIPSIIIKKNDVEDFEFYYVKNPKDKKLLTIVQQYERPDKKTKLSDNKWFLRNVNHVMPPHYMDNRATFKEAFIHVIRGEENIDKETTTKDILKISEAFLESKAIKALGKRFSSLEGFKNFIME